MVREGDIKVELVTWWWWWPHLNRRLSEQGRWLPVDWLDTTDSCTGTTSACGMSRTGGTPTRLRNGRPLVGTIYPQPHFSV